MLNAEWARVVIAVGHTSSATSTGTSLYYKAIRMERQSVMDQAMTILTTNVEGHFCTIQDIICDLLKT